MYACIREIGGGFFEGVCALSDQSCISSDPPPSLCANYSGLPCVQQFSPQ